MGEWRTIESAPKDEMILLVWKREAGQWSIRIGRWVLDTWASRGEEISPTHWQPLPEPPKEPSDG